MLERGPAREPPHRVQLSVGSVLTWADFPSRGPRCRRTPARRSWPSSRPLRGGNRQIRSAVVRIGEYGHAVYTHAFQVE